MRSLRCPFGGCERQSNERLDEISLIRNHRISVPRPDMVVARGAGPQIRDGRLVRVDRNLSMTIRARVNNLEVAPRTSEILHGEICGAARTFGHSILVSDLTRQVNDGLRSDGTVRRLHEPSKLRTARTQSPAQDPTATGSIWRTSRPTGASNRCRLSPPAERRDGTHSSV
jgi:hypothetical protein